MILPGHQNNASWKFKFARVWSHPIWLCLLLVAVTLAIYWPVVRCDFVDYDDPDYFSANTHVLAGLTASNVVWAFCTGHTGNWHPLTWLSLMLDGEWFGPGPAGPHFTNLSFHLANTVLLFLLFRRLTAANWRSALVAALFALHPLHVESVAWISERKDVLCTGFGLLALLCYAKAVPSAKCQVPRTDEQIMSRVACHVSCFYWLALFCFVLALMSKPMAVTLPFIMLLLDFWPLGRFTFQVSRFTFWPLVREKVPFFLLSAVSCVVTLIVQKKGGAVAALAYVSVTDRIENALVAYARYLGKTFWPVALPLPDPLPGHWELWQVVSALVLVAGLSYAAVRLGRRFPFVPVGWFWFVGTLIPVIGLVQVGSQSLADRYTYVPLIGVFIIFVWGAGEICARGRLWKPMIVITAVFILAASALRTRDQIGCWQNSETLFRHTLALTEHNFVAWNDLGTYLSGKGQVTEAINCFLNSLEIDPTNVDILYDLGNALTKRGKLDEAVNTYRRALQIAPDRADILNNLGFALSAQKQYPEAIACFEAALKLDPDYADAHNNLATAWFIQERFDEAVRHYREALRLEPGNAQIHSNLGDALVRQGQTAEAVRSYQEALRLKPDDAKTKAKLQALGAPDSN
jgi:Tfp pilus assembly protein PilF